MMTTLRRWIASGREFKGLDLMRALEAAAAPPRVGRGLQMISQGPNTAISLKKRQIIPRGGGSLVPAQITNVSGPVNAIYSAQAIGSSLVISDLRPMNRIFDTAVIDHLAVDVDGICFIAKGFGNLAGNPDVAGIVDENGNALIVWEMIATADCLG
jgi:hypothetical protein